MEEMQHSLFNLILSIVVCNNVSNFVSNTHSVVIKEITTRNVGQCPTWWSPCRI